MSCRIHVIADNAENWTKPSTGRFKSGAKGNFVSENGFGFEDWNFNQSLVENGYLLAHTTARIAQSDRNEILNILWSVLINGTLYAIGYYRGVKYTSDTQLSDTHVDHIAKDIFEFAQKNPQDVSENYKKYTFEEIRSQITLDNENFKLIVEQKNIHLFKNHIKIPEEIINYKTYRTVNSYKISEEDFLKIVNNHSEVELTSIPDESYSFDEGSPRLQIHTRRERSAKLVSDFKKSLKNLSCTVCNFNFEEAYGELGKDFIECHHTKPVSQMKPGDRTSLDDLVAVCSNCHRMLHRSPSLMLSPADLRAKLR